MMFPFPVLLADIEGLMGVVFFVIAFIGWIMNLSKENKQVQERKPRPNQPGKQKGIQNEIDQFLQETKRGERKKPRERVQQVRPDDFLTEDDIVIVEEAPRRRAPQQRQRKRVTQAQPTPPAQPQPTAARSSVAKTMAERKKKPLKKDLSSIRQHVEQDLPHCVNQNVTSHLGTFLAGSADSVGQKGMSVTTRNRKTPALAIIAMMRTKTRVRDAIIVNEVLSKPPSLRK